MRHKIVLGILSGLLLSVLPVRADGIESLTVQVTGMA